MLLGLFGHAFGVGEALGMDDGEPVMMKMCDLHRSQISESHYRDARDYIGRPLEFRIRVVWIIIILLKNVFEAYSCNNSCNI